MSHENTAARTPEEAGVPPRRPRGWGVAAAGATPAAANPTEVLARNSRRVRIDFFIVVSFLIISIAAAMLIVRED
jgi:hypothetical protein